MSTSFVVRALTLTSTNNHHRKQLGKFMPSSETAYQLLGNHPCHRALQIIRQDRVKTDPLETMELKQSEMPITKTQHRP